MGFPSLTFKVYFHLLYLVDYERRSTVFLILSLLNKTPYKKVPRHFEPKSYVVLSYQNNNLNQLLLFYMYKFKGAQNVTTDTLSGYIINLHHNSTCGNHHYMQLYRSNFIVGNSFFPGHAKELFHSRIAAKSHGRSHLDHMRRFFLKNPFSLN